jgi:DNA-binding NarL/FixJ family response regulator
LLIVDAVLTCYPSFATWSWNFPGLRLMPAEEPMSRPDLAIMDIRLAGRRDGVEAAIEIFTTLGIRSIFSSAHDDAATRKRAIPASPIGWLRKPYSANALIELIKSNLE